MSKRLSCLLLIALLLSGCSLQPPGASPHPDQAAPSPAIALADISISTENAQYPVGVRDITLLWTNKSDRAYFYGEAFSLEQKTADGWQALPQQEGVGFRDIAIILEANSTRAHKLALSLVYGALPVGEYRAVLTAYDEQTKEARDLTAAFLIAEAASTPPLPLPAYDAPAADLPARAAYIEMQPRYPLGTEEIEFAVVNGLKDTLPVVMAPMLERAVQGGWEALRLEGGFCGTPDPVPPGGRYESSLPMGFLYPDIGEGVYRMTLAAYDEDGASFPLCAVFAIGADEP